MQVLSSLQCKKLSSCFSTAEQILCFLYRTNLKFQSLFFNKEILLLHFFFFFLQSITIKCQHISNALMYILDFLYIYNWFERIYLCLCEQHAVLVITTMVGENKCAHAVTCVQSYRYFHPLDRSSNYFT